MRASVVNTKTYFQLKADFLPITVCKIINYHLTGIDNQLKKTIQSAPNFFKHAPLIIDVQDLLLDNTDFDLAQLCANMRAMSIIPIGIRGLLDANLQQTAKKEGLALIINSDNKNASTSSNKSAQSTKSNQSSATPHHSLNTMAQRAFNTTSHSDLTSSTLVIREPVRAGNRIYSNGDVIVLGPVNPGGEVIAVGHVHVYGPLRGRALAGAKGDTQSRIFCRTLSAELISIAGHYLVRENIKTPNNKDNSAATMLQIYLDKEKLTISQI